MRAGWLATVIAFVACHAAGPDRPPSESVNRADGTESDDTVDDACDTSSPAAACSEAEDPSDTLPESTADGAGEGAANARAAVVAEAHRELRALVESHYIHRTHIVEASGIFDYDCSGFVGYALGRAAPSALQAVVAATRARPLAKDFEAFFTSPRAPWSRVDRATDLVPGDVIAWLEPPAKQSRNTGHVMIVDQMPRPSRRPGELIVAVIDSSHSGHGAADARNRAHQTGLGTGELVLLTDIDGRPIGYRWSLSRRSIAYRTTVALGHLP